MVTPQALPSIRKHGEYKLLQESKRLALDNTRQRTMLRECDELIHRKDKRLAMYKKGYVPDRIENSFPNDDLEELEY